MIAFKHRSTAFLLPSPDPVFPMPCLLPARMVPNLSADDPWGPVYLTKEYLTNVSGIRTGLRSTLNMIPPSCRTSAPIRRALSLCRSSPYWLVNPYYLSHTHIHLSRMVPMGSSPMPLPHPMTNLNKLLSNCPSTPLSKYCEGLQMQQKQRSLVLCIPVRAM